MTSDEHIFSLFQYSLVIYVNVNYFISHAPAPLPHFVYLLNCLNQKKQLREAVAV